MRYRMLDVRIWCDEKFRSLTPLKPSGQALFLYLLSNPHTTSIPGLYRAGAGAMAEELGWSLIGFHRALKEVIAQGLLKADLKARVIFIHNAIKYNKPQSPNVVRSWVVHWDEIPECVLKNEAYYVLQSFVNGLGKAFAQAFDESLSQPTGKISMKSFAKPCFNQEQEQEQEQKQEQEQEQGNGGAQIDQVNFDDDPLYRQNGGLNKENVPTENLKSTSDTKFLLSIPLHGSAFYQVTKQEYEEWQSSYTQIDVLQELRKLIVWNVANPDKRKRRPSILRHIHAWLDEEQQKKLTLSTSYRPFPVTFEHNLRIAKKWLMPTAEADNRCGFQWLEGKKNL